VLDAATVGPKTRYNRLDARRPVGAAQSREQAMKLTIAISLVAHLIVIGLLRPHLPSATSSIVVMSVFDRAAPPSLRPAPPTDRPIAAHAVERAPRPRMRRAARALPPTAPPPPPMQTLPNREPAPAPGPEIDALPGGATGGDLDDSAPAPASPARASLRRDPDLEAGSCVRGLAHPAAGKYRSEVVVRLRLTLDNKGQVTAVDLVERAGDGFDDIAVRAVRERCHFSAALDERGRPVPFMIDDFRFRFPPAGLSHVLMQ
jgi:hypothetical protein